VFHLKQYKVETECDPFMDRIIRFGR
jgi:hypothetical protein